MLDKWNLEQQSMRRVREEHTDHTSYVFQSKSSHVSRRRRVRAKGNLGCVACTLSSSFLLSIGCHNFARAMHFLFIHEMFSSAPTGMPIRLNGEYMF